MDVADYWPMAREYSIWNATVASQQFWTPNLDMITLSTVAEVYSAFFYTTSTYTLHQQSDKILFSHVNSIFLKNRTKTFVAGDKPSPGTNPGFLKSEENGKLHTFIYTTSVSENICVYNILFQHFDCYGNG